MSSQKAHLLRELSGELQYTHLLYSFCNQQKPYKIYSHITSKW